MKSTPEFLRRYPKSMRRKKRIIIDYNGKPHLLVGVKAILREMGKDGKSKGGKPLWVPVEVEPILRFLDGGKKGKS